MFIFRGQKRLLRKTVTSGLLLLMAVAVFLPLVSAQEAVAQEAPPPPTTLEEINAINLRGTNFTVPDPPAPPQTIEDIENINNTPVIPADPGFVEFERPQAADQTIPASAQPGAGAAPRPGDKPAVPPGCKNLANFSIDSCVAKIVYLIMWLVSWVLFLAGLIFDISIHFTLNMSDLMTRIPVVDIGWKIFRDLANICFIFILLWIAISTILGLQSGKTKELLAHLIIVALLINFSLFITKAVVDASNIVALHFYNLIVTPTTEERTGLSKAYFYKSSFSGAFMEGLKIQTLYDGSAIGQAGQESRENVLSNIGSKLVKAGTGGLAGLAVGGPFGFAVGAGGGLLGGNVINWGKIILIGFFGSILMITAAYVFLVAAILFLIRVVVLMFVMMLSPLAFLAFILPATASYAEQWKEALIKQSLFAPLYLALSFVVVKAIQTPAFKAAVSITTGDVVRDASFASAFTAGSGGGVAMVVNFLLLIALMLGCILVAKKMEAYGHETAIAAGKAARGFITNSITRGKYVTPAAYVANKLYLGEAGQRVGEAMQKIPGLKTLGKGVGSIGKNLQTKEGREKLKKKVDITEIDRKIAASTRGTTVLGDRARRMTTGALAHAEFGYKSAYEDRKEDIELRSKAEEVQKKKSALKLDGVRKIAEQKFKTYKKPNKKDFTNAAGVFDNVAHAKATTEYEKLKNDYENAESAVASAVSFISPQGFADMTELDIHKLAKYANVAQIDAVIKNPEFTLDEKRKMLDPWAGEHVRYFTEDYDKQIEAYERDQNELEKHIKAGTIDINIEGKVVEGDIKDASGKLIKTQKITDGNILVTDPTGKLTTIKKPVDPVLDPKERAWARNAMTVHAYEDLYLLNPEAFKSRGLTQPMRWGYAFKELRFSNILDPKTRESLSKDLKDAATQRVINTSNPYHMEENTDTERTLAYKDAADAAEDIITSSDKKYADKQVREKAARDAWAKVIADKLRKDVLVLAQMRGWRGGRSATEAVASRGATRTNKWFQKIVDRKMFDLINDGTRDDSDVAVADANLLISVVKDRLGIEEPTPENKESIHFWFEEEKGRRIPLINFETIEKPEELGFKDGKITFTKPDGTTVTYSHADFRELYNELREKGKSPKGIEFESDKKKTTV